MADSYSNGYVEARGVDLHVEGGYGTATGRNSGTNGYTERSRRMVTAAARPHVFWVAADPGSRARVRGWPVGPALLETLGALNSGVGEALAAERVRLDDHGYPDDLPLPALWWTPRARPELVELDTGRG